MTFRTDKNNNPAAITTDIAKQAGLKEGVEYVQGDPFNVSEPTPSGTPLLHKYFTAKLIGDPIALTIKVIDAVGYYTKLGTARWIYMAIPRSIWLMFTHDMKVQAVKEHYVHEGGVEMMHLFPAAIKLNVGSQMEIKSSI